ncbi:MAG: adenylate/guanylate cyclase domain-containing protein [Gemmatimonadota bacterium]
MISIRESFAAKLLSAFLGTVGLLLILTVVSVRVVTGRQLQSETALTIVDANRLFDERAAVQRESLARLSSSFTTSRRAVSALDAAIKDVDIDYMAGNVEYELLLQQVEAAVVVFTDEVGQPVLSIINGERITEGDPVGVVETAEELLIEDADMFSVYGYRLVDGMVYNVETVFLGLGPRPVGTVTFGLPVAPEDLAPPMGDSEGGLSRRQFEACLFFDGSCALRTDGVAPDLESAMLASVSAVEPLRVDADDEEWSVQASALSEVGAENAQRVVAVRLGPVLAPFESIINALLLSGLAALGLAVVFGRVLSRNLTAPVRALVDATGRVARGDYDASVQIASRDEMGKLAHAFNDMTVRIREREQLRAVLNKVVSKEVAEELMSGDVELGGELREMSVLFADIRGFTPLTEGMEPQAVIALLNECMEELAAAVDEVAGVVDKYIGDELMAVFGAPNVQPDHAFRAVCAAVRMREGIDALNRRRSERGEGAVGVGIGIASGTAVAGNMGSTDRMNYTVLGSVVNLAARLTSAAQAGEIIISEHTRSAAGSACITTSLGGRALKGFSSEIDVYAVEGLDRSKTRSAETAVHRAVRSFAPFLLGGALAVSGMAGHVALASAQWPTLRDAGVGYLSDDGRYQIDLSGQLDLEAFYFSDDEDGLSGLAYGSGALFAPRARLFLDVFLGDHVYGLVEWRGDRGEAPTADFWEARVEQAYISVGSASGAFQLQGGIFTNPFGSYANRHLTVVDPFVRPPLLYDYRTVVSRRWSPAGADWFLRWRDNPDEWRRDGAPPVWGVPYQWGGMVTGEIGIFRARFAGMNSAPSSEPIDWYEFDVVEQLSWVARVEATISPELTLGASYNDGPYTRTDIPNAPEFPLAGTTYDQRLWGFDFAFARGPAMIRGEFVHDSWDVPNVDYPAVDVGYSLEVQTDVAAGWSIAARAGRLDFRPLGMMGDWDWDTNRFEASVAYRITRNGGVLASWGTTWDNGPLDPDDDLLGVRLWWAF